MATCARIAAWAAAFAGYTTPSLVTTHENPDALGSKGRSRRCRHHQSRRDASRRWVALAGQAGFDLSVVAKGQYERGLNREIVAAVDRGKLSEPLTTDSVRQMAWLRGWKPAENFVLVVLPNASDDHSPTYPKYFHSLDSGRYQVRDEYRGPAWR